MTEYANLKDKVDNISSIEIPLDSPKWEITDIELNFTDIEFKREIREIEGNIVGHLRELDKNDKAYAIQINITENTDIFGVQIYGYESKLATTANLTVQINGYDSITNKPNETIYGSTLLNMSSDTKWYFQTFDVPIPLPKGYYYLVLNGTEIEITDGAKYYWGINDVNPSNPNLYSWGYGADWINGLTGDTFLYKLDQKIAIDVFPEAINMSVEIGKNNYPITNGSIFGTGNLNLKLNLSLFNDTITIPIKNKLISDLIFNVNYSINVRNTFLSEGSLSITDLNNEWNILPEFSRFSSNYSVKFNYTNSWENFTIYRNIGMGWENITLDTFRDPINHFIILPNETIIEGADWIITANSPNINFEIINFIPETKRGELLEFNVIVPIVQGNLTYVLIKPSNISVILELNTKVTSPSMDFSWEVPLNYSEGVYTIKIYWNNETDAGVQSKEFQIIVPPVPFTIHPLTIFGIVLAVVGISAFGLISYNRIKKYRIRHIEAEQKTFSKCMDIMNLDYLIVTNKRSGLAVYEQRFTSKELNGTLISGFLQAISSFGIELMKVENQSQTIKLEYKNSIILMSEFVNLRLILIMKENPSRYFLFSIEDLAYDIYKNYGTLIDQFNGDVQQFKGIEDLLIKYLNISLIYPQKLVNIEKLEKIRTSPTEKAMIAYVKSIMDKKNIKTFYIKDIIWEKTFNPKDIKILLKLIEKNIIQAAN
ncbi:MAG: hypothetical protein ACFFA6_11780 [Promethearchaeota archaeon]